MPAARGREVALDSTGERYVHVISTIPIPTLLKLIGATPTSAFRPRTLVSLFYRGSLRSAAATAPYNFTYEGLWKRAAIHSEHYGRLQGDDWFTVEVTLEDGLDAATDRARADFEGHLIGLGLLSSGARCVGHAVTPRAYPV